MKRIFLIISLLNFYITMTPVMAQIGEPYIHDPSTPLATTAGLGTVALTVLVAVLPPTS